MAVVDDDRIAPAIGSTNTEDGVTVASWSLGVKDKEVLDLVFMNVSAETPASTLSGSVSVEIALAGWDAEIAPPAYPPTPTPRKPASKTNRPPPLAPGELLQDGLGSTKVERDEEGPPVPCIWPGRDFGAYCGPLLNIRLQTVAAALSGFGSVVGSGGVMSQALATMGGAGGIAAMGAAGMAGIQASSETAIDIRIPLPEYGYVGSTNKAVILVSGGGLPERGAYGPKDALSGNQTYFPATGRVEIESYSLAELSGTFEATLVELPLPLVHRESQPALPSAGTIRGRFLVTRPWEGDGRFEMVRPSTQTFTDDLSSRRSRPDINPTSSQSTPTPRAPSASGPGSVSGGNSPCECSCEEKRRVFTAMESLGDSGAGTMPSADQMQMAMCTMGCSAAYLQCPD